MSQFEIGWLLSRCRSVKPTAISRNGTAKSIEPGRQLIPMMNM